MITVFLAGCFFVVRAPKMSPSSSADLGIPFAASTLSFMISSKFGTPLKNDYLLLIMFPTFLKSKIEYFI